MAKLVRWETPFTDSRWPSVLILTETDRKGRYLMSAVVAPKGIDLYPKYRVHFGEVVAFTCMEEMHFPERDFADAICDEEGLAAYEFLDSTWLKSYSKGEYFLFNTDGGTTEILRHFLLVGGDNNVEVITKNMPVFETISKPSDLSLSFPL